MSTLQATALVVRGFDWSETSRIITLWSREYGKIRGLAKGARRLKSNFEIAFDMLTVVDIAFIHKANDSLDIITEAKVRERFAHLRNDLKAMYAGYYLAELLSEGTPDFAPHPALFDQSLTTLRNLANPNTSILGLVSAFELAWLNELGYRPELNDCAGCAQKLNDWVGFSPMSGGIICQACAKNVRDARSLTRAGWHALRGLTQGDREIAAECRQEVRAVLSETVSAVLGRRPKLLRYIDVT